MNIRKPADYSVLFSELDNLMAAQLPQMELYCEIGRVVSSCSRFSISSMNPLAFVVLIVLPVHLPQPEAQNGHTHAE